MTPTALATKLILHTKSRHGPASDVIHHTTTCRPTSPHNTRRLVVCLDLYGTRRRDNSTTRAQRAIGNNNNNITAGKNTKTTAWLQLPGVRSDRPNAAIEKACMRSTEEYLLLHPLLYHIHMHIVLFAVIYLYQLLMRTIYPARLPPIALPPPHINITGCI